MKRWMLIVLGPLTACQPSVTAGTENTQASVETTVVVTVPQASPAPVPTSGTAEEQLKWLIKVLNGTAEFSQDGWTARFNVALREQLPFEQFVGLINQLSTGAPFALADVIAAGTDSAPGSTVATETLDTDADLINATLVSNAGSAIMVTVGVDEDGRISALSMDEADAPELPDQPTSLTTAAAEVAEFGTYRWVAASIPMTQGSFDDVVCSTMEGFDATRPIPLGTMSRIWVLGAVADAIEAGELSWDTKLMVTEATKSIPPGVLHERPDESPVTVQGAATLMFESSDNTAMDLLIDAVGREQVEEAQQRWGNSNSGLNRPFLTTKEMVVLKTATAEVQDRYLASDPDERNEMVTEFDAVPLADIPVDVFLHGPVRPVELNWFASPADVCTGMARLMWTGRNVDGLGPLVNILTTNHGVPSDAQWSNIGFTGGSEPGLLTMGWVMESDDGSWYSYVGGLVNEDAEFDTADPTLLLAAGRDLVAIDASPATTVG